MSNQQLIRSAHIWALAVVLAAGAGPWPERLESSARIPTRNSNSSQNANKMTSQDRNFIMDAAMGGMGGS
jgi:hypothetical protein